MAVYAHVPEGHDRDMRGPTTFLLAMGAIGAPAATHAQALGQVPAIAVTYNAAIVSDYRFRGLSLTNRKPAVQGGIDLGFRSGFFLGTWASNIANYGGSVVEVDVYGGYAGSLAGFDYSAGVYGYLYPDGRGVNYVELQSTIGHTIGPVTSRLTVAYIPSQDNAVENLYLGLDGAVAIIGTPLTVRASVGRETGGFDHKYDWSAGLTYTLDALDISASYVDSNYKGALEAGRNGRAAIVLAVRAGF